MNLNDPFLSDLDRKIIEITGFGKRRGFGKRPALLVVDAQNKFVGIDAPIIDSMAVYPLSIGEKAWKAVQRIGEMLERGRRQGLPVFFSTSAVPVEEMAFNSFARKRHPHETSGKLPEDGEGFPAEIQPRKGETLVHKRYASVFFGTPLMSG